MVHPITARSGDRASRDQCPPALPDRGLRAELPVPARYVLVPDPLIAALAHDPLAIGVYVAIARLTMVAKAAVPLAARDLAGWMGTQRDADRAAIMRRIVKLEEGGWVIVERTTASKHRLLPTWGRDQAGIVRPWRFDTPDSGRPGHLRGRRVPLALFDDYLGRLDPGPGQGRALVSRYFTRPLLDLTDIGVYAIGLRAEIVPTPRLRHLGLHSAAGMLSPRDGRSLLEHAAAGTLTILEGDAVVPALLSIQGQARLNDTIGAVPQRDSLSGERPCGSIRRSPGGSVDRSRNEAYEPPVSSYQDGQNAAERSTPVLIAWDVGIVHESTNHDSAPDHVLVGGGAPDADAGAALSDRPAAAQATHTSIAPPCSGDDSLSEALPLAASVAAGHRTLNPTRTILPGEWHEVLGLQETHGENQLLIWQARASRAMVERPHGITPAYYHACAAQAACDVYRPSATWCVSAPIPDKAHTVMSASIALDPACDALLRAIGVRERQKLAAVPFDLIEAWQIALGHPGLAAQLANPVGFAVAQMRCGNLPPPVAELDRWADRSYRKDDRYEVWRYVEAPVVAGSVIAQEQQLETRVRALAPPDADLADLCELARCIETGATDAEALACLRGQRTGEYR
jgi:hypothetical protein